MISNAAARSAKRPRAVGAHATELSFARLARRNPLSLFRQWFAEAHKADIAEPEAMTLATADADMQPRARTVLLKSFSAEGFVFFTDLNSRKASALRQNRRAALLFYWPKLGRQILLQGSVRTLPRRRAAAYFASRPHQSRIHAWASAQSQPIESPAQMRQLSLAAKERFADKPPPLPPHWGGFVLSPRRMEFWQADEFRLHQRLEFIRRSATDGWRHVFLQP